MDTRVGFPVSPEALFVPSLGKIANAHEKGGVKVKDRDELPVFRPRFGKRARRPTADGSASLRNAVLRLVRRGVRRHAGGAAGSGRRGAHLPGARRVIVKAHVVRLTATGVKAASLHLRYIERDGVEKDGSKGVLYDAHGPAPHERFEEARPAEKHQFRVIVSPEDAGELDLTAYVRTLLGRIERDLGRKLEWAAVNHYNTDHPHAHVVIRGVDQEGRELRLDRSYISNGLRLRAQELATEELGPRREEDIRLAHTNELVQNRFTSLDRELERRAVGDRVQVPSRERSRRIDNVLLVGRLERLENMRLAVRLSPTEWVLADGWQHALREMGSRGDIIQQIHRSIRGDPARYHIVRLGQALPSDVPGVETGVTGRVAEKGLSDELKGAFYMVVETPGGRAFHVPLDARSAESVRPGDLVTLTSKPERPVRPVDRHIAEVARRAGGVYELGQAGAPDDQVVARRMRDLERLGLAAAARPKCWNVSPNLLDDLERKDREQPARYRLHLQREPLSVQAQVPYPGPVWLDRTDARSLAPYGLGAEIHRALEQRRNALRELGIAADDPNRFAKLREHERRSVGRDVAERSGQSFLANSPDVFRGRAQVHASPSGTEYLVITDGSRFVVLGATAASRDLQGRSVAVARGDNGQWIARQTPDRGRE